MEEAKEMFSFLAYPTKARCCRKMLVRWPSAPDTMAEAVVGEGTDKLSDTKDNI
jgi:hypothetical protein